MTRAIETAPRVLVVGTGFGCRIQVPALCGAGFEVVGLVGTKSSRTAERADEVPVPQDLLLPPPPPVRAANFDDGVANMQVLDAIRESAREGGRLVKVRTRLNAASCPSGREGMLPPSSNF